MTSPRLAPARRPRLAVTGLVVAVGSLASVGAASPAGAQDWPLARHDTLRTARQPAPTGVRRPGVLATVALGGGLRGRAWLAGDEDHDGQLEVYVLRGGRVVADRPDGVVRWASPPLALDRLLAVEDFDGDGRSEVFAGGTRAGLLAFDALTGEQVWSAPLPTGQRLGEVLPLDVDADGVRELYVAEAGAATAGRGTGRVYAFPEGIRRPATVVELAVGDAAAPHGYWNGTRQAVGDLDGDGEDEIVTQSHDHIIVYDPRTGARRWISPDLGPFPFGTASLSVADLDGDGRDEVIAASNNPTGRFESGRRLLLLELESGSLSLRWRLAIDPDGGVHAFPRENVANLTDAPGAELATSIFDPIAGTWSTLVFSGTSATPTPVVTLPGERLVAVSDLDGDGRAELLVRDASASFVPAFGTLRALRLSAGPAPVAEEVFRVERALLPQEPLPWRTGATRPLRAAAGTLVLRDSDGNQSADQVIAGQSGSVLRALPAGVGWVSGRSPGSGGAGLPIAMSRTDGGIGVRDRVSLSLLNPASPGSEVPGLVETRYLARSVLVAGSASGPVIVTVDGVGNAVGFGLDGSLRQRWRRDDFVASGLALAFLPGDPPRLLYSAREADGTLSLLVVDGVEGTQLARYPEGEPPSAIPINDLVPLRDGAGGVRSVVAAILDRQTDEVRYRAVDPESGAALPLDLARIRTGSGEYPGTAHDADGDGSEDLVVVQGGTLEIASGVTGALLSSRRTGQPGGVLSFIDLDADGTTDVLRHAPFGFNGNTARGARRLDASDYSEVWSVDGDTWHWAGAIGRDGAGAILLGLARIAPPWLALVDAADGTVLQERVPAAGRLFPTEAAAESAGASPAVLTGVAAVAGDGADRYLVGSTDGHLYQIRGDDGGLDWSIDLGARLGDPIAADVDADGRSEVLIAAGDGHLYVIGQAALDAPAEVFDTDGSFVAAGPDEDLDELRDATTVGANWSDVAGATQYEARLVRSSDGLVIAPWTDVSSATRIVFHDLELQPGQRYETSVRASDRAPGMGRVSRESSSDGFIVVDDAPPAVDVSATPAVIWPFGGGAEGATHVAVRMRDDVGLSSYGVRVEGPGGAVVDPSLAEGPATGVERTLALRWAGLSASGERVAAGEYRVIATVDDVAAHRATGSATVTVCTPEATGLDACHPAQAWEVRGGGCQCDAAGGEPAGWLLIAPVLIAWRRRRLAAGGPVC